MKSLPITWRYVLLIVAAVAWLTVACTTTPQQTAPPVPAAEVKARVEQELRALAAQVDGQLLPLAQSGRSTDSLHRAFEAARLRFKRVEPFTEYFMPGLSRLLNGPPFAEIEVEETKSFDASGFQVVEELIYPEFDPANRSELLREVHKLQRELRRAQVLWQAQELTDAHVFDAARLEVFRVVSLGITGFDTPLCGQALTEAAAAVAALRPVLAPYAASRDEAGAAWPALEQQLRATEAYLRRPVSFNDFDRLRFITAYANPLSRQLAQFQQQAGVPEFQERRALRASAATLFDSAAFDADFYAPTQEALSTPAKVALGKKLFFDASLSGNGRRSCASCHQPAKAFADGLTRNSTLGGGQVARNTPTLLNAALQAAQFYDMRSATLENQAADVVGNPLEMHGSLADAARRLPSQPGYAQLFAKAFPQSKQNIGPQHLQMALASYERSLVRLNSRFDRHLRSDKAVLTPEEAAGFNVFMGKGKCGTCHFAPLFNGTVPPAFTHAESEVLGITTTPQSRRLDPDQGRYAHTRIDQLRHAFKTPTVRNIALTAPYMHNGTFKTLEEVIDFYNEGGGAGRGLEVDNQTLAPEPLNLTTAEKSALKAFLLSLTDASPESAVL